MAHRDWEPAYIRGVAHLQKGTLQGASKRICTVKKNQVAPRGRAGVHHSEKGVRVCEIPDAHVRKVHKHSINALENPSGDIAAAIVEAGDWQSRGGILAGGDMHALSRLEVKPVFGREKPDEPHARIHRGLDRAASIPGQCRGICQKRAFASGEARRPNAVDASQAAHPWTLRWEDVGIPSSSRYLATVLRLTVNPSFLSLSEISWSETGCFESSPPMISLIRMRTFRLETSSPDWER